MDLKLETIKQFLESKYNTLTNLEPLGAGDWSKAYAFTVNKQELVVRFSDYVDDFRADELSYSFASADLPIPQVFDVGEFDGGYCAISSRHQGRFLENSSASELEALLPAITKALAAMRNVELQPNIYGPISPSEQTYGSWQEFVLSVNDDVDTSRNHGWKAKLQANAQANETFEKYLSQLQNLCETIEVKPSLCHSDLINKNVLVDGERIEAVFDWGNSIAGDALYDYAWFDFWAPWHEAFETVDWRGLGFEAVRGTEFGGNDAELGARFDVCALHIGLVHLAYNFAVDRTMNEYFQIAERMEAVLSRGFPPHGLTLE